jgi:riboflavin transporter FmnP
MNATVAPPPIQQDLKYNLPRWALFMLLLELACSAIIPADARLHYILFVSIPTGLVCGLAAGVVFTLLQHTGNTHRRPVKRLVNAIMAGVVVSVAALAIFSNLVA